MIVDSHTHAWLRWPYEPLVPDVDNRGRVEQLLWEMDRHGVDKAVLVCANITHNPDDNDYVAECVARYPERLIQFADVDCKWSSTYHLPGAAGRLRQAAGRYQLKGFTHYLQDDTEWFASEEGLAFFEVAADLGLIASLALSPAWQPALRELARQFPSVPFLCHHMAGARVGQEEELEEILRSAEVPNIYIKLSGFHYASQVSWDYPQADTHPIVRALYDNFGPARLCWGSDYPVVRFHMTYQQALEAFRTHCTFVSDEDKELILGGNLERLLASAG
ncbi:MAG: amidohydrolase family protein [Chloroflexota bacterium]|nr:amidohydrolase family protein [Chloroflexota bacterium]